MEPKVLLADDSETIQKVIELTLATEKYNIIKVNNEDVLLDKTLDIPDLILLDFHLSKHKTGYQLSKTLRKLSPTSKIVLMLGHFDSIDSTLFKESLADQFIKKPFNGPDFIQMCKSLIETRYEETKNIGPEEISKDEWELNIPDIIDGQNLSPSNEEFPPIINNQDSEESSFEESKIEELKQSPEMIFPSSDDLVYPDDNLQEVDNISIQKDHLEELISDDIDSENLWSVDEITSPDIKLENIEEDTPLKDLTVETLEKAKEIEIKNLTQDLKTIATPIIENIVKQIVDEIIEKVAWEVIPDLAENIIKKELSKIADSVIKED